MHSPERIIYPYYALSATGLLPPKTRFATYPESGIVDKIVEGLVCTGKSLSSMVWSALD